MIKLPNPKTKTWTQQNNSDTLGDLFATYNIDLNSNQSKIRLGRRMLIASQSSDSGLSGMGCPVAFKVIPAIHGNPSNFIYSAGGTTTGSVYYGGLLAEPQGTYTIDSTSNAPANIDSRYSDLELSSGNLYATGIDKLYECASGTWSATTRSLGASVPHMMTSYGDRIYVTDLLSQVLSADTSSGTMGTLATVGNQYTLQFKNSNANVITFLRSSANRIWIGTVNTLGGKGYIYSWDGSSSSPTASYRLDASGALSCVIKDDIPWVVDTNGNLLAWNGASFQIVTQFYRYNRKMLTNATSSTNSRFIHPNGMSVIDNKINILINNLNNDSGGTIEETIPSGVWEYDPGNPSAGIPAKGLYHKASLGLSTSGGSITDYGQNRLSQVGALSELITPTIGSYSASQNGKFLAGVTFYTDQSTTRSGVFYDDTNDTLQKAGYFVTTKIQTPNITEIWQTVFVKLKPLANASDRIVLKYRVDEANPTQMDITYTSTTTFTTTNSNMANYAVGDEVEIVQGLGSGICSHITVIANNAGTYTVTVDETHTGATTQTAKARFNKWTKISELTNDTTARFVDEKFKIGATSPWVQLKVWMVWTGATQLDEIQLQTKSSQDSK
jgi:hypothetical protein